MNHLQKILANATFPAAARALGGVMALVLLSGCASMVGSARQNLPIRSTPADAQILIIDETGETAYRGRTPDLVALDKSDGRYWGGKQFTVAISKRGYLTQRIKVDTHPNAFYLGGNLLFGGLIGWLIIDPANGKMYDLSPDGITVALQRVPDEAERPAAVPEPPITSTPLPEPALTADPRPAPAVAAPRTDAPARREAPPRPYWPAPPPLPVSPSTAAPGSVWFA